MFKFIISICIFILAAEDNYEYDFTAISGSKDTIYVAAKKSEAGVNPTHKLVKYNVADFKPQTIETKEIEGRDIVALFLQDKKLLVLSQSTVEMGDQPQLHELELATNKWNLVGKSDCIAILGLELKKDQLVLDCEKSDEKGIAKSLKINILATGKSFAVEPYFKLPQKQISKSPLSASLITEKFNATKLKVSTGKRQKDIHVRDLFR